MKRGAEVVVIGGGVNGCSIAYNLAKKGCRDVVVVEKGQVASGASGRCPGGFRHQWSTRADILLMTASIRLMMGLQEELDHPDDLEIRQCGYLFMIYTEAEREQFRKNIALQRSLGIPVEELDPQQMKDLVSFLSTEGLLGGAYCPWDGRASPYLVTHAYARAAERLGVEIYTDTQVTGLLVGDGKVTGVMTDQGPIEAGRVVCVAGSRTTEIARMAGVELPIHPDRRHALVTERWAHESCPGLLAKHVAYFQTPYSGVMAETGVQGPADFCDDALAGSVARTAGAWAELVPSMAGMKLLRAWAGNYDMSPDAHPIVGPIPGAERFYVAAGFSGHGFMMAPIVGLTMAEMLLGEPTSVDVSALDARRFEGGEQLVEKMVW